jgi:hypothetical protein
MASLAERIEYLLTHAGMQNWQKSIGVLADVRELERNDARYRKVKEYVTVWESQMQETLGKLTLSIEFNAVGDDLDAALDAITKTKGST